RLLDDRYDTIMQFMADCFPHSFVGIVIEPTTPTTLYAKFVEKGRSGEILASGVSDGHLQMLILLTALFSDGRDRYSMLLIDEPETSLHPWALAVLAKAIRHAAESWGKQILVATHSPVLISQFDPDETLTIESREGRANLARLSEIPGIQDLLEQYATGTLYMSELIAGQSQPESPSPQAGGIAR
ncbi:MAG: AAA family ATPase, partial [Singulisphaera sp.]